MKRLIRKSYETEDKNLDDVSKMPIPGMIINYEDDNLDTPPYPQEGRFSNGIPWSDF